MAKWLIIVNIINLIASWTNIRHWMQFWIEFLNLVVAVASWCYFLLNLIFIHFRSINFALLLKRDLNSIFLKPWPILPSIFIILFFHFNFVILVHFELSAKMITYRYILFFFFLFKLWWFSLAALIKSIRWVLIHP